MPNSITEVVLILLWTALITWYLGRFKWSSKGVFSSHEIQALFILKVIVGVGLAVFYEIYYHDRRSTDAFRFFDDAIIIYNQLGSDPLLYLKIVFGLDMENPKVIEALSGMNNWYKQHSHGVFNDNQTIIRFNALLLPISQGYFHVHTVVASFLSFTGFIALISAFTRWVKIPKVLALIIILFPQVVFWSSGVLKESLLFFAMGWFFFFLTKIYFDKWSKGIYIGLVLTAFGMFLIKNYIIICMIPGVTAILVSKLIPSFKRIRFAVALIILQIFGVVILDYFMGSHRAHSIFQKQKDFIKEAIIADAGSFFETFVLEKNWVSIIVNSPTAFLNTLTKPSVLAAKNIITLMASVENIFIMGIWIFPIFWFKKPKNSDKMLLVFCLGFFILLYTLIGLTTPVAGALIRYKIPALPFLFVGIYLLTDYSKLKERFIQLLSK
ncbi:MAG: hypothetical protein ACPGEG_07045 [Salibacteraceae bacterium]